MAIEGRFRTTVAHYLRGRPPYAAGLIHRVAEFVRLTPEHVVLDLGCGPGQLARAFAPLAGSVLAMDPEPAMLRAANAAAAGLASIRFVAGGSDDLMPSLGRFRLVVMGRSFHWMDRAETLRRLNGLIEPCGAVALFDTTAAEVPVNAWLERYHAIRRRYAGDDPERRPSGGRGWLRHEAVLLDSPFGLVEGISVYERRYIDAASLLDRALSMSSTSPAKLGPHIEDLRQDISALIAEIAPSGRLTEIIRSSALIARRA